MQLLLHPESRERAFHRAQAFPWASPASSPQRRVQNSWRLVLLGDVKAPPVCASLAGGAHSVFLPGADSSELCEGRALGGFLHMLFLVLLKVL